MLAGSVSVAACTGGPGGLPQSEITTFSRDIPVDGFYPGGDSYPGDKSLPIDEGAGAPVEGEPSGKGGSNSGKGGSDTGKGGTDGGGNGTCDQIADAYIACNPSDNEDAVRSAVTADCEGKGYSGSCKACVAKLSCSDIEKVRENNGPAGTSCESTCSGGGEGGTGGTGGSSSGKGGTGGTGGTGGSSSGKGGTGGTGGSSSGGGCVSALIAKGEECDEPVMESQAAQICELVPACGACLGSSPCSALEAGGCDSVCKQD